MASGKENFGFKNYSMLARYTAQAMMYNHRQQHNFELPEYKILPLRKENEKYYLAQADCLEHCATAFAIALKENIITINLVNRIVYFRNHGLEPGNYYLSPIHSGEIVKEDKISLDCWRQQVFTVIDNERINLTLKEPKIPILNFAQVLNIGQSNVNSKVTGSPLVFDPESIRGNKALFVPSTKGLCSTLSGVVQATVMYQGKDSAAYGSNKEIEIALTKNELIASPKASIDFAAKNSCSTIQWGSPIAVKKGDLIGATIFLNGKSGNIDSPKGESNLSVSLISF